RVEPEHAPEPHAEAPDPAGQARRLSLAVKTAPDPRFSGWPSAERGRRDRTLSCCDVSGRGYPSKRWSLRRCSRTPAAAAAGMKRAGESSCFRRRPRFGNPSSEPGGAAIRELGDENGFAVDHSEDPAVFSEASLAGYRVVVFLS